MYKAFYWMPLLLTKFYLYVRRKLKHIVLLNLYIIDKKNLSLSNDTQVGVGQIGVNQVSDLKKMRVDFSKKTWIAPKK